MKSLTAENTALAMEYLLIGALIGAVIMIIYWPEVV